MFCFACLNLFNFEFCFVKNFEQPSTVLIKMCYSCVVILFLFLFYVKHTVEAVVGVNASDVRPACPAAPAARRIVHSSRATVRFRSHAVR